MPTKRRILSSLSKTNGSCEVTSSANLVPMEHEAALNLFETDPVDALFTDIQLGGELTGWDIAESLRAMQPDLAVIYTSGNGVDRTRQVSRALFFDKPYDCSRVAEACQELLQQRMVQTGNRIRRNRNRLFCFAA